MANITLHEEELDIDIREELEEYSWHRPTWKENKLIAASPFRYDNTPSFFVNLETGGWADSGAYDAEYESGNLAKLLAFLRDETYEETCDYLFELYGVRELAEGDKIKVAEVKFAERKPRITLDGSKYNHQTSLYLRKRGIEERVQRFMGIGHDKRSKAITMPWRHADGALANVKYRKENEKTFWYTKGAAPVAHLVYGIDKVYKHNLERVVVCEAEIDAMSWYMCGVPAIAIGGVSVSRFQIDLIRKSPIKELIIAGDNDKAGNKLTKALKTEMHGYVAVETVKYPSDCKDANEALQKCVNLSKLVTLDLVD